MGTYQDQYPTDVPQAEAIARIQALTDYWDTRYRTRTDWCGNRGTIQGRVLGISFKARFSIDPGMLRGEMEVSFIAMKMGGRQYLKHKLDEYLDPSRSVEQLRSRLQGLTPAFQ